MRFISSKCARNAFAAGAPPRTPLGRSQRSPDPLAGFKGPTSNERGGEGREGGMGGKVGGKGKGGEKEGKGRKGREEDEREGRGWKGMEGGLIPHFSLPSATPAYNNKP